MQKSIAIRVDADCKIGIGHLKRCLSLATYLRSKSKYKIFFIIKHTTEKFHYLIKKYRFKYFLLKNPISNTSEVISILKKNNIDKLIIDHYRINQIWEKKIKKNLNCLIVIDDLNRPHLCDYLFKQNLNNSRSIKNKCEIYSGRNYFIIDSKNNQVDKKKITNRKKINILINFGSNDKYNLTCTFLKFLIPLAENINFSVIIEKKFKYIKELNKSTKGSDIKIYQNLPTIAYLTHKADICFGSGGIHNIERVCLGKLSYVVVTAKNQIRNINFLKKKNYIVYLGTYKNYKLDKIDLNNFNSFFLNRHKKKLLKYFRVDGVKNVSKIISRIK
jgi:UDP-2,4-diacetamido-2,4,6-trideoxy-beta-L-altropyranose hydrolase